MVAVAAVLTGIQQGDEMPTNRELEERIKALEKTKTPCEANGHEFYQCEKPADNVLYCKKCGDIRELPKCSASGGMGFGAGR